MSQEIYEYGKTASNVTVKKGRYAVDPNGHVILVPMTSPIKQGWRLATQADIDACGKPAPAPSTHTDTEPPISIDEPIKNDSDPD